MLATHRWWRHSWPAAAALIGCFAMCTSSKEQQVEAPSPSPQQVVEPVEAEPHRTPHAAPNVSDESPGCDPRKGDKPGEIYAICGCGCCGEPGLPSSFVDSVAALEAIKREDAEAHAQPVCAVAGCSMGTVVQVCIRAR